MKHPLFIGLLVFSIFAVSEVSAQTASPDLKTQRSLNRVLVKVIVPFTSRTPEHSDPVVESWVVEELQKKGETEYSAITEWVPVCDGLAANDAVSNRVWAGGRLNDIWYCPVNGDIPQRKGGRLLVNVGGWLPSSGCEANIELPDEPGRRAVGAMQILVGKARKPMKTDDPLPYVAVKIGPPAPERRLYTQKEKPKFFTSKKITSTRLAAAVNYFVNLGEEESVKALNKIAKQQTFSSKIDVAFRVACVCRILWRNSDSPVVPPKLGMYGGGVSINPRIQAELKAWPLFPVAKSGDSYFVIVNGGRGGTGQSANLNADYIQQCQNTGTFLTREITEPTAQQFQADAELLRESGRWSKEFRKRSDEAIWLSIQSQNPKHDK